MPQDLPQHAQAVEVVIRADLAKEAAPVLQLNRVVCAVELLHLLGREAEVVMLEDMGPCLLCLRTRLASILGLHAKASIELVPMVSLDGFLCWCCAGPLSVRANGLIHIR